MSNQTPLPEFFGRLTTVLSQHEHLGETLKKLDVMCDALEIGRAPLPAGIEPAKLMAALREDLAQHFVAEESEAHFGVIARENAGLLPGIVDLKADHTAMLTAIHGLALVAADEARWPELVIPTRQLVKRLRVHERAEAVLLQEYLAPADNTAWAAPARSELASSQPPAMQSSPFASR